VQKIEEFLDVENIVALEEKNIAVEDTDIIKLGNENQKNIITNFRIEDKIGNEQDFQTNIDLKENLRDDLHVDLDMRVSFILLPIPPY